MDIFVGGCKHRANYAIFWRGIKIIFFPNNNAALVHCSKIKVRNGYNMEPLRAVSSLHITSNPNVQKQITNNNDVT